MIAAAIASTALLATTVHAVGQAIVVNNCDYDVYLCNVPSSNGGYEEIDKTLSSGDTYSQDWTPLTNGNGWSLKLSKTSELNNILQYEYTVGDDSDMLWYDLSEVNGNPWDGNWEITANNGCNPKQQAYRFATDDAYGMQSCTKDSSVTVTLCSGENGGPGNGTSPEESSSAPAYSAPSSTASPTTAPASYGIPALSLPLTSFLTVPTGYADKGADNGPAATSAPSSSAAPAPASSATEEGEQPGNYAATVTQVHTAVVTSFHTSAPKPLHYGDGHFWRPRHQHHAAHHA